MKLTKTQLRQIIKEELKATLREGWFSGRKAKEEAPPPPPEPPSADWRQMEGRDFEINHNLFMGFVEDQYPDLYAATLNNRAHDQREEAFKKLEEVKWKFPHDVDPEMNCTDKIVYLDVLVRSYTIAADDVRAIRSFKRFGWPTTPGEHPTLPRSVRPLYHDRPPSEAPVQKEGVGDGRSPYEACLLDLRAQRAAHDELRDVEGRGPRQKNPPWWTKIRLPGEKK